MRNKSLKGGNYTNELECLLLFATLIDEMTFNYTYDSYKAPALNVVSLLNEAEETLLNIGRDIIREEGVRSVMEELSYAISSDEIFKQILDRYGLSYIASDAWLSSSHSDFINCFAFIKQIKIAEIYFWELKSNLSSLVKSNREKKKIENLTRIFVSYLCYLGYSEEFIYMVTTEFFFSPASNVIDVNTVDLFLNIFEGGGNNVLIE